jgi:WD40 repeat protein
VADDSVLLGQLAEEFTDRVRRGQLPQVEEYAARHPALGERIRALFPTLLLLEGLAGGAERPAAPAALTPGSTFGPYRIEREIGRGGMGVVYEATHLALNRRVALKVLPMEGSQAGSRLERFLREARTAAGLHHTNIVPVFDVGQVGGVPYYAMQYIEGRSLDQHLHGELPATEPFQESRIERPSEQSAIPLNPESAVRVAEIGLQVAEGLAYAHERGVIHRDIKPSNLLVDAQGVVWITDFGLARRLEDVALTHSGVLIGTPRYMSPEQAEAARRPVDHRTDLYSLGATLYELLTHRPAFDGKSPQEVVLQILDREPLPPRRLDRSIPRDLETIVLKAMAKRPEDRYATARELADDLRRFLNQEPIRARRIGLAGRFVRWCKRNPMLAGVSGAAILLLTLMTVLHTLSLRREMLAAVEARKEALKANQQLQELHEKEQDQLCSSLHSEARSLLVAGKPGRRWLALERLEQAERLRARERLAAPAEGFAPPSRAELRSTAAQALLLRDARLVLEQPASGLHPTAVAPGGRFALRALAERDMLAAVFGGQNKPLGGVVQVLDLERNQVVGEWPASVAERLHQGGVVALSPDGRTLAHGSRLTEGVALFAVGQAEPARTLRRPLQQDEALVRTLWFAPDGSRLAAVVSESASEKGLHWIVIWDLGKGSPPEVIPAAATAKILLFDPNSRRLAWCSGPKEITVSDLAERTRTTHTLPRPVCAPVAFLEARVLLLSCKGEDGGKDGFVSWDLGDNKERSRVEVPLALEQARAALSPTGAILAVLQRGALHLFARAGQEEFATVEVPALFGSHLPCPLAWSEDGRRLAAAGHGLLRVWELSTAPPVSSFDAGQKGPDSIAFSPDGRWVAVAYKLVIRLLDRETGRLVHKWVFHPGGALNNLDLTFRPDSRQLIGAGVRRIVIWNVEDGTEAAAHQVDTIEGVSWSEASLDLAGRLLAVESWHGDVWDVAARKKLFTLEARKRPPLNETGARFSPTGRFLAAASAVLMPEEITIWDMSTGKVHTRLRLPRERSFMMASSSMFFSPDGGLLALRDSRDLVGEPAQLETEGVTLWDTSTGKQLADVNLAEETTAAVFSPDGRLLAAAGADGLVLLWDTERQCEVARWRMPGRPPASVQFTPDGRQLAFTSDESPELRFLDLASLREELGRRGLDW